MIQRKERQASSELGSLDALLIVLLLLLFAPCLVALWSVPWTAKLEVGALPATVAVGAVVGVLLVLVHLPRRWWWIPFGSAPLLGGAIALGASIVAHGTHGTYGIPVEPGTILFGGYIAGMVALLPWLVFRAAQPWLAVVLVWITIVGAWGRQLGAQQVWWLVWLLAASVMLLGLAHLRAEKRRWDAGDLERIGPVLWPSARSILTLSLLVAVLGLLPLGLTRFSALSNLWSRSGLAGGGPLVHESGSGTPVAELGAPLPLSAPDVGGDQVILTYQIIAGPASAAPLFGAALYTFDGTTWSGTSASRATVPAGTLQAPSGSRLLQARITIASLPSSQRGTPLLGFDQPLTFSVPAQAVLLTTGAPSMLNVAGWSTGRRTPLRAVCSHRTC
jgi:hypothetical protein